MIGCRWPCVLVYRRKPGDKPMPGHIRRGNATRSSVRAGVDHVFCCRKGPMGFTIRRTGQIRTAGWITMASLGLGVSGLAWLIETRLNPGPVGLALAFGGIMAVIVFLLALIFAKSIGDV